MYAYLGSTPSVSMNRSRGSCLMSEWPVIAFSLVGGGGVGMEETVVVVSSAVVSSMESSGSIGFTGAGCARRHRPFNAVFSADAATGGMGLAKGGAVGALESEGRCEWWR